MSETLWGVIIGASAGLLGTGLTPWVRDHFDRRATLRERRANERTAAAREVVRQILAILHADSQAESRTAEGAYVRALSDLEFQLDPDEHVVAELLNVGRLYARDEHGELRKHDALLTTIIRAVAAWGGGELTADRLLEFVKTNANVILVREDGQVTTAGRCKEPR